MSSEKSVTVKFRKYFKVGKTSPEPIRPENVKVNITSKEQPHKEPNFLALCILWAHFQACRQGLLTEDQLAPWEQFEEIQGQIYTDNFVNVQKYWTEFLNHIITDASWTTWITKPEEVKRRAIDAYSKLQIDTEIPLAQDEASKPQRGYRRLTLMFR
jgi:hypothetical protein